MQHALDNAILDKQSDVESALRAALAKESSYQTKVRFAENTFAGFHSASILVLLALGLSIIFGLMGVINMAHGEFMMVGAFATWGVSEWFKVHMPGGIRLLPDRGHPRRIPRLGYGRMALRSARREAPLRPSARHACWRPGASDCS